MIPGLGKINPKQMQAMMKQMGINQEEIDAARVTIEKTDGGKIVIDNPNVQRITMSGQESFQISGEVTEVGAEKFSESDVQLVMEKTEKSREEVLAALEETGDIAEAIMKLSE